MRARVQRRLRAALSSSTTLSGGGGGGGASGVSDGAAATDDVDSYSCSTWQETGPEVGYYFQAPIDQANEVTVSLSYDWQYDFDVFVMEDKGVP